MKKKTIIAFMSMLIMVGIVGCGASTPSDSSPNISETNVAETIVADTTPDNEAKPETADDATLGKAENTSTTDDVNDIHVVSTTMDTSKKEDSFKIEDSAKKEESAKIMESSKLESTAKIETPAKIENPSKINDSSKKEDFSEKIEPAPALPKDEPQTKKECSHLWEAETTKEWVDEAGHYETQKEPYTDYKYTYRTYSICAVCGGRFETEADIIAHFEQQQALVETTGEFGPCAGASYMIYEDPIKTPITSYNEVIVWVVDEKGHYESVETGNYSCSKCGATK